MCTEFLTNLTFLFSFIRLFFLLLFVCLFACFFLSFVPPFPFLVFLSYSPLISSSLFSYSSSRHFLSFFINSLTNWKYIKILFLSHPTKTIKNSQQYTQNVTQLHTSLLKPQSLNHLNRFALWDHSNTCTFISRITEGSLSRISVYLKIP